MDQLKFKFETLYINHQTSSMSGSFYLLISELKVLGQLLFTGRKTPKKKFSTRIKKKKKKKIQIL